MLKDQPSFILKTRRIQYTFEKYRKIQAAGPPVTLADSADMQLVNELRFWATKYIILAWIGGINLAYLSYHVAFRHLKRFIGLPLTFIVFFEGRNMLMKNCMDKIYYPLEPLYQRLRKTDKKETEVKKKQIAPIDALKKQLVDEQTQHQVMMNTVEKELN